MKKIFIIIPVYNRREETRKCILSLNQQTYKDFSLIVFDDGSTDKTDLMLKEEFGHVRVLKGDGNYFWSKSVNQAVVFALDNKADYILTLNNDLVLDEYFVESFVNKAIERPDIIMGSSCYDIKTGKIIFAGSRMNWRTAKLRMELEFLNMDDLKDTLIEVDHLGGRGLWIPADVFKKIGLFNEKDFPHYIADYDFTLRAKKAGFGVYCNIESKIYSNDIKKTTIRENVLLSKRYSKNLIIYLSSIKSPANLKIRWKFAVKNCPKRNLFYFIILDTLKVLGSYVRYLSSANKCK
ncbi:MAG: glycosyltransferase family 2 protein [Candidatus Omnitrophota bacterium]